MRTYIFTDLEKGILRSWLNGEISSGDIRVRKILSRVRLFSELASDLELYLEVRRRLAEPKSTGAAYVALDFPATCVSYSILPCLSGATSWTFYS